MQLVEVIRGLGTSDATVAAVDGFAKALGKQVVHAFDAPASSSIASLQPMLNEAIFALGEGVANVRDIDTAIKLGLNHPMGAAHARRFRRARYLSGDLQGCCMRPRAIPNTGPRLCWSNMSRPGWLGRTTGKGFYDYAGEEPVPTR